jgi:DNA replicative helicase MCM subunit Mcm2 (Cdc46/Mcm family)
MCQAWDSDCLQLMKKKPITATGAHISIIGQLTKDELLENFDKAEISNGFFDRFLWVVVRRSKLLLKNKELPDSDRSYLAEKLSKTVTFARTIKELKCDYQVQTKWAEVYQTLSTEQLGLLGLFTAKAELQVMRLACLYALLDCSETILIHHLEAALSLWQYCEDSVRYIFDNQTGSIIADSIYKALLSAKEGMTKTDIRDLFQRNQTANRINEALSLLLELGRIEVEKKETKGRYIKVYRTIQSSINNQGSRKINDN